MAEKKRPRRTRERILETSLALFNRFGAPITGVRWPIMILYWLGQAGIAAAAWHAAYSDSSSPAAGPARETR